MPVGETPATSSRVLSCPARSGERLAEPVVIRPCGELDIATSEQLRAELAAAAGTGVSEVIVDLTDVTFLDASAIGVLVSTASELRQQQRALLLAHPGPLARKLLHICRLGRVLPVLE